MNLFFGKPDKSTAEKARIAELEATVAAINLSQAVIEFELDGTIITANENFLPKAPGASQIVRRVAEEV